MYLGRTEEEEIEYYKQHRGKLAETAQKASGGGSADCSWWDKFMNWLSGGKFECPEKK